MAKEPDNPIPTDLVEDYAEIGVEKLIEGAKQFVPALNELSTEIPYVKTLVAAIKFPRTLSDFLLGKKVSAFLYTSGLNERKVKKFKKRFSRADQERLWERVVFSINMHDDKKKSEIVGKLFSALVDEFISQDEFFDMVHATNSLNLNNLEMLKGLYMLTDASLPASLYYTFATMRLIDVYNVMSGGWDSTGGGTVYPLNESGWKYVGIVYDNPPSGISGVRIGAGDLIAELDKDGKPTYKALPLQVITDKGSRHQEVDLFVMTNTGGVLCSDEDLLPRIIGSSTVKAGETPQTVAERLAEDSGIAYDGKPESACQRLMEESPVQKCAFVIISGKSPAGTLTDAIVTIKGRISGLSKHTDQSRYLTFAMDALEKIHEAKGR